jgi:NitT/TauT family transport system ATP-binding protein
VTDVGVAASIAEPVAPSTDQPAIHCRGVSCVYRTPRGEVHALDQVTFSARSPEFVGIVGPSGCGKTTLLRIIAGLQPPTSGRVVFENAADVGQPRIGLVFQEHGTFPWMTVLDNLALGLRLQRVPEAERRERARAIGTQLGLADFMHHYPGDLSVGMRQRVEIGRAFVSNAPVLLMDEPFGALDAQTKWVLQEELLHIWQADRKLIVFITHDIDEAVRLSDRVLVLSGRPGRIRAEIPVTLPGPRDRRDTPLHRELAWHIRQLLDGDLRSDPSRPAVAP